jgi:nucleoside-diphosphate-sugar epimerase
MNSSTELHVVFGTGPLGKNTARELVRMGKRVRMINRSGKGQDLPAGVEVVAGDAYSVSSTTELTRGATAVYQCAQPHYHEWAQKFPALQSAILEGAAANGAKLIVGDNLYCYGGPHAQPISEATPQNPHTRKGQVRKAMADAVLAAHQSGKVRAAIGRASDFVGPEYDVMGDLVIQPALKGETANLVGRVDMPHTFTYIPDFGRGLAVLGTHDEALGRAWIVPSAAPVTQQQLIDLFAAEIGQPIKTRTAGALTMRVLGLFNPSMREMVEMMYEWNHPYVVDSSLFERTFGIQPTPLPQAVRETVAWYRLQAAVPQPARA